ncbi:MAG: hypothetical protein JXX28_03040 [Deltaproteobacteria bacterium]|nr:hypothetical protein [Deltaproteobacteria bacterium]
MPQSSPFSIPAGVDLSVVDGKLSVHHDGDIILEQTMGLVLERAEAGGDLTLTLPLATGDLVAGGRLTLKGDADAGLIFGDVVVIAGGKIKARAIAASSRIVIGAAHLSVDVLIAPEIRIDPNADGRVTVIESHGEVGPSKIKGGFNLREYEEIFGDANDFLAARGLEPLAAGEPQRAPEPPAAPEEQPEPAAERVTVPAAANDFVQEDVAEEDEREEDDADEPVDDDDSEDDDSEDDDDPQTLRVEDMEPLEDELAIRLDDAIRRIEGCYTGLETPDAVQRLADLIARREYRQLKLSITEIWNSLLKFHQEKNLRPHHQVTHSFNQIHGLVQGR